MMVLDANVAAKWFLNEKDTPAAMRVLESGVRMAAPSIIRLEVAGAISRQFREGAISEARAKTACATWHRMIQDGLLHLFPMDDLYDAALALAFQARHPIIDCLYLALAKDLSVTLITADGTLAERAPRVDVRVITLASYGESRN